MLNPPLDESSGNPIGCKDEIFVLERSGMGIEIHLDRGVIKGTGRAILTTLRMVCLPKNAGSFKAFDLPLAYMHSEEF